MNDAVTHEEIGTEITMVTSPEIEAMLKAGIHLGHAKSKNSPAMQPYIYGVRNTISIIDLIKTEEKLGKAMEFVRAIASRGGSLLLVGTRPGARKMVLETALSTNMPYFVERWIGGALTNYKMVHKRVEYMEILEKERETGEFDKYTKKERMRKEEEITRLKRFFDGLRKLKRMPDAVFVVDITHDTTAVAEARKMKIPVIALCDTNSPINLIDFPIPSNDHALPAVTYMLQKIARAIEEGQRIKNQESGITN